MLSCLGRPEYGNSCSPIQESFSDSLEQAVVLLISGHPETCYFLQIMISYSKQMRHMTGELDPLSPMTKKMRLLEIMDYLSNPNGVAEALGSIPPDLGDYQDVGVVQMQLGD